jgi:quercetin dioxygenase-like cupin family protein
MNAIDPKSLSADPGNPSYFTGAVTLKKLAVGPEVAPNKLLRVEFAPGARTNWHSHTGVQILFVAEGRCRFQHWDGPVQEAGIGETIYIPAGEKHWHGASPDAPMVHVALNIDFETKWLEPVSEEQYREGFPH